MKQALQTSHFKPNPSYTLASETTAPESISAISANYDRLTQKQQQTLSNILENNKEVFDQDLSVGYNQFSGKHMCKLKWANNERPSSKKVHCVQYNSQLNALLQQVCDQLTADNVLGIPQQENVEVQHVMPCFLRKKQRVLDRTRFSRDLNSGSGSLRVLATASNVTFFICFFQSRFSSLCDTFSTYITRLFVVTFTAAFTVAKDQKKQIFPKGPRY